MPPNASPRVYTGPVAPKKHTVITQYLASWTPWAKKKEVNHGPLLAAQHLLPPAKRPAPSDHPLGPAPKRPKAQPLAAPPAATAPVAPHLRPSLAPPASFKAILKQTAAATATPAPPPTPTAPPPVTLELARPTAPESPPLPVKPAATGPSGVPPVVSPWKRLVLDLLQRVFPTPLLAGKEASDMPAVKEEPRKTEAHPAAAQFTAPIPLTASALAPPSNIRLADLAKRPPPPVSTAPSEASEFLAPAPLKHKGKSSRNRQARPARRVPTAFPNSVPTKSRPAPIDVDQDGFVPMELCAVNLTLNDPDSIDVKTGIRHSFYKILHPDDPRAPKPKPGKKPLTHAQLMRKPKGHMPEPKDRLFARPLIQAEPSFRKRERKSNVTRFLTDADCLKFDKYYITWDCTSCLRTFLDKEALAQHKPQCKLMRYPEGGPKAYACQYCRRGFPNESVLLSHKQHNHGDLNEVKEEVRTEELRLDVDKIQIWVDKCSINSTQVEACMNTLHQLYDMLTTMKVYLASETNATKQLAGREMMVMIDIAVKASALGCSTSAVSVADITNANPTVVAGLFHAIAHLEGFGLIPGPLRRRVDDTRRKRNIVFHTLGVVLDEVALERQCALAVDVLRWAQVLMDRTLNVVSAPRRYYAEDDEDYVAPPREHVMEVESGPRPYSPTLATPASTELSTVAEGKLGAVPAPTLPVGVSNLGNQSGIPAWKYTAPAIPILNKASTLLGAPPTRGMF